MASLEQGMTFQEVVARWGAPRERVEREVSRQDLWIYGGGQVVFEEGRVKSWRTAEPALPAAKAEQAKNSNSGTRDPTGAASTDPSVVQDILAEIMREPPSTEPDQPKGLAPNAAPVEVVPAP